MKALTINGLKESFSVAEIADPVLEKGKAVVRLKAAALNHRDLFIVQGQYAAIQFPAILGSDGAGEWNGKRVLVYPALDWGDRTDVQGKGFRVLGMPDQGAFAEQISVPEENVFPMPGHLDWAQGAALPLAGLTAWRTLFSRCELKKGEKVLISGIGGGVAIMAMQFALAAGAEVYATTGHPEKAEKALKMGAQRVENYKEPDWDKRLKQAAGGFDVIIDSAGGDGFALFPALCNPGARIGFYGGSLGKVNGLSLQPLFWKQISLLGSTMGSPLEFKTMLDFVEQHKIVPVVDSVFPLANAQRAFERMEAASQFGKIVVDINI